MEIVQNEEVVSHLRDGLCCDGLRVATVHVTAQRPRERQVRHPAKRDEPAALIDTAGGRFASSAQERGLSDSGLAQDEDGTAARNALPHRRQLRHPPDEHPRIVRLEVSSVHARRGVDYVGPVGPEDGTFDL